MSSRGQHSPLESRSVGREGVVAQIKQLLPTGLVLLGTLMITEGTFHALMITCTLTPLTLQVRLMVSSLRMSLKTL